MPSEAYLLLLQFGQARERAALDLLRPMLARVLPAARIRTILIDNAAVEPGSARLDELTERIAGDNALQDFSGWDKGLAWIDRHYGPDPDALVILANDTVARDDKHARVRDVPADRVAAASSGSLVGWVDEYPRPVGLFGYQVRQFVDTSLVFAERRTLAALGPLAEPIPDALVFADDDAELFREPSPLSENYREYLKTYFVGGGTDAEYEHAWYAQAPLASGNAAVVRAKIRAVFCEHLLSAKARRRGFPLVDIRPVPLAIEPTEVATLQTETEELRQLLAEREASLKGVTGSLSWKITAPLRALDSLLRGRRTS